MATAKLTMLSFHKWMTDHDDNLFKNLNIPEGIDKDSLINNILLEGAEFEVLYSDPIFMANAIGIWSAKWHRTFEKWIAALNKEYDPLQNYNGDESVTTVHGAQKQTVNFGATSNSASYGEQVNNSTFGSQTDSSTYGDRKATSETDAITNTKTDKVSAYDSENWSNQNQATDNLGAQKNTTTEDSWIDSTTRGAHTDSKTIGSHTDSMTSQAHSDVTDRQTFTDTVTTHREGNLGITSSQKLLTDEIEVQRFNLIQQITDLFLNEFCIMIYI